MFFKDKIIKKNPYSSSSVLHVFFPSGKLIITISVALFIWCSTGYARDLSEGMLAAQNGNYKLAAQHLGPLAEQGNAIAQFNLAMMYHAGLGVDMNEAKAVEWYIKSANNGYHKAQEYLTVGYREGWFGLPVDPSKADYWEQQLEKNTR